MSRWRVTLILARWEFLRFFKWKTQLISMAIGMLLMIGMAVIGPRLISKAAAETTDVGVIGAQPFELPPAMGLTWREGESAQLREAFEQEEIGALLTLLSDTQGTLEQHSEGGWELSLQAALDGARREARLAVHALDPDVLSDVNAPFELKHIESPADQDEQLDEASADSESEDGEPGQRASRWDKIIALSMLGFMFGGVFTGTALLFTGITTEKQQLVTEQIVAAVPPQTWIDGKILGIGTQSLVSCFEMVLWMLFGMLIWRDFVDPDFVGLSHVSPGLLSAVALLAVLGFWLWFCFFGAIAATINDPNTSGRSMMMLLPMLAPLLALPVYFHPDDGLAVLLSLAPPTATMALTVRLGLSDVPAWQYLLSVAGMIISIWAMRRAAGKVFAMAIMMQGKELSWREIWSVARKSS